MSKAKAFDLSSLDTAAACEKPFDLELFHPVTKAGLGCGLQLVGKESSIFKGHVRRRANERLRKQAMQSRRGKDVEIPTIEQIEADAIDLLVACTKGVWGDLQLDGQPVTYSEDNVRSLYTRFAWVREQVDEAVGDLENFIKA